MASKSVQGQLNLPPKEQTLFKKMLRCYEHKQYKQGLKAAKQILSQKQFAEHGETLAMKGLILNGMQQKEEAYDLARRGIRAHITSHVCWHVFGLIYRSDKDYNQAIKCYRNALKYDPGNFQILRDLSMLQIQMRDIDGFRDTCAEILKQRPSQRASWIGLAIAQHLTGEYPSALQTLEEYEKLMEGDATGFEISEVTSYRLQILIDAGQYEAAVEFANANDAKIRDRPWLDLTLVHLYEKLGKDRLDLCEQLVADNPEHQQFLQELERAHNMDDTTPLEERTRLYMRISENAPWALLPKRRVLSFAKGDELHKALDTVVSPMLRKGVPALFRMLRSLYVSEDSASVIDSLVQSYVTNIESSKLHADGREELPTVKPWVWEFAAQHYDARGDFAKALQFVNRAIEHTPTVVELYMTKAKILKHMGNTSAAARWLDYARCLDTADRFLNSKCVKYLFRAGRIEEGREHAAFFLRESSEPLKQLVEMQCAWYLQSEAEAHLAKNDRALALKRAVQVCQSFEQFIDDQFDFHSYCARKLTLRSYIRMLRFEDRVQGHKHYIAAASLAARLYMSLHELPLGAESKRAEEEKLAGMSESERKKYLSKQRKAAKKAAQAAEAQGTAQTSSKPKDDKANKTDDADAYGEQLAKTDKPLDEAAKLLKPLLALATDCQQVQELVFDLYYKKNKGLLMLRALKALHDINSTCAAFASRLAVLQSWLDNNRASLPKAVSTILVAETTRLAESVQWKGPDAILSALANKGSLEAMLASRQAAKLLGKPVTPVDAKAVAALADPKKRVQPYVSFVKSLAELGVDTSDVKAELLKVFPQCNAFGFEDKAEIPSL